MDLEGRRVGVMGLGMTGAHAARFLAARGARVVATDQRAGTELAETVSSLREQGVVVETGGHSAGIFDGCDLVVISPGVPPDRPALARAREAGAELIGEIELAFRFLQGRIAGVTGSNGKSTVTALAAAMLRASGSDARACGNIGLPLIAMHESFRGESFVKDLNRMEPLGGDGPERIYVAELSSFQLEAIRSFRPAVAALLNLSPDHLDRYDSPESYYEAKIRIFMNQGPEEVAILNADDPRTIALAGRLKSTVRSFSTGDGPGDGVRIREGVLLYREGEAETELAKLSELRLPGSHNLENAAAASCIAMSLGAAPGGIRRAISAFEGLPHRIQHVGTWNGKQVYDDSKATNIGSAARALDAFEGPVVLLLGGRDKGGDFADLVRPRARRIRHVIAFGEAGELIERQLEGITGVKRAATLSDAAGTAWRSAEPGDVILLSPGCASFDEFTGYAARGEAFSAAMRALAADEGGG